MLSVLWDLLCFLVALGILIAVHELGHFTLARACGVKVLRFSLGFGRVLWSRTGRDGCEYALSALPLGGYVKMLGENEPLKPGEIPEEGSFKSKSPLKRGLIIAAGPLCNVILAVLLYTGINLGGIQVVNPVVGDVVPGSAAQQAGFELYDRLLEIDGREVNNWQDVLMELVALTGKDAVPVTVASELGQGARRQLNLDLSAYELNPRRDPLLTLGLRRCLGRLENVVGAVQERSPAAQGGLKAGDRIISIDGTPTPTWYRLQAAINEGTGQIVRLVVEREGKLYESEVVPTVQYNKKLKRPQRLLGISADFQEIPGLVEEVKLPLPEAFTKGLKDTYQMSRLVLSAAVKMLDGSISAENISGPIAIARGAGQSASVGFVFFLSFLAAISVNLGILNLLPIPVLDGGQLLFIVYEALVGRAPGAKVQVILTGMGLGILLTLMALAVFNDLRAL
ncbi:MAG: RIP metalloprotease RseP [Succinivibrio sp.]|nr:RIP metalloprotease RseP [Succinivibrio sp.]